MVFRMDHKVLKVFMEEIEGLLAESQQSVLKHDHTESFRNLYSQGKRDAYQKVLDMIMKDLVLYPYLDPHNIAD